MTKVIDTNFRGLLVCTRKAYHLMSESNDYGLIININSVAGHTIPFVSFSMNVYSSTKYAVTALTESIRQELYRKGNKKIRIAVGLWESVIVSLWNFFFSTFFKSVSPGLVESSFIHSSGYFDRDDALKELPMLHPKGMACYFVIILKNYQKIFCYRNRKVCYVYSKHTVWSKRFRNDRTVDWRAILTSHCHE